MPCKRLSWAAPCGLITCCACPLPQVRHPYVTLDYANLASNANTSFLLLAREAMLTLKGQMVPVTLPGEGAGAARRALLFLGSPRCSNLQDMQVRRRAGPDPPARSHDAKRRPWLGTPCVCSRLPCRHSALPPCVPLRLLSQAQHLYLSDIPLHDMSRDFILLAEQRQVGRVWGAKAGRAAQQHAARRHQRSPQSTPP